MIKVNQQDKILRFWEWFDQNKFNYDDENNDWDPEFELISEKLNRIDQDLNFEIEMEQEDIRQLIITANGCYEKFPIVKEIVKFAPLIEGWEIRALQPEMGTKFVATIKGNELKPSEMYFFPYLEGEELTIILYAKDLKGMDCDDSLFYGRWLLMSIIGEYDFATKVTLCYLDDFRNAGNELLLPLTHLRSYINSIFYNCN